MMTALNAHLATGLTTVCRCWRVDRRDGMVLGFTDHDRDLAFSGLVYRAETGMTARTLVQSTGLNVDDSEALGILSDDAVTEADIAAGRYDGAEVRMYVVNWTDVSQRALRFRGTLGEVRRGGGAFHAELRGLAEPLNQDQGRAYQPVCDAVLGDAACRVDLSAPGLSFDVTLTHVSGTELRCPDPGAAPGWFRHGLVTVLDGPAAELSGVVREDTRSGGIRRLTLWEPIRAGLAAGDRVRLRAGCDKSLGACKGKFDNFLNFRGFPHIPGEDWLAAVPRAGAANTGGRRDD